MSNDPCPSCGHQKAVFAADCCVSCGYELRRVFESDFTSKQYDNALEVTLAGGYGMFFDSIDSGHRVFLCHDCAHGLCDALPWLANLIRPEHSHAHTAEFRARAPRSRGSGQVDQP